MLKTFHSQLNQRSLQLVGIFREKQLSDNSEYQTKAGTLAYAKLNLINPASKASLAQVTEVIRAGRTPKSRKHGW